MLIRHQLNRVYVLAFFHLSPCLLGIEACGTSHNWSRELKAREYRAPDAAPYVKPRTHIDGFRVPVEEPSATSRADILVQRVWRRRLFGTLALGNAIEEKMLEPPMRRLCWQVPRD